MNIAQYAKLTHNFSVKSLIRFWVKSENSARRPRSKIFVPVYRWSKDNFFLYNRNSKHEYNHRWNDSCLVAIFDIRTSEQNRAELAETVRLR
jgi:hypothetical protein